MSVIRKNMIINAAMFAKIPLEDILVCVQKDSN